MSRKKNRKQRKKQAPKPNDQIMDDITQKTIIEEKSEQQIETVKIAEKPKRESVSKKLRFEVFKRDSFKCQYCGRSAPEVILNVDHIIPVAADGTNDIMNLITSCFDCNNGKRDHKLSDNTVIQKQYSELEKLNERREQLEMMIEWKKELEGLQNTELEYFEQVFSDKFNKSLTEYGKKNVSTLIKKYSLSELLIILDSLYEKDINDKVIENMEKWAKIRRADIEKPYLKDIFYIRKILDNKFGLDQIDKGKVIRILEEKILSEYNVEWLKGCAQKCDSLWQFYKWIENS
jgi:5-methylcytosine-specific restriction endonuclease McrA